LREDLYRTFGVDLTQIPGIHTLAAQMLLTEIGPDPSCFPTAAAFCSWLRLCPEPKISGGKVLSSKTRPTKNRVALALRMAAQGLHRSHTFLGDYFRRESPARNSKGDDGSGSQTSSHRLSHDHHSPGIRHNRLSRAGAPRSRPERNETPSSGPCTWL